MPDDEITREQLARVPLFPLPNVVLFPRAVLPLHIFEARYRQMTADALAGNKLVAMALLLENVASCGPDAGETPAVATTVCVGRIMDHERLPDGRYNLLLQGILRASLAAELSGQSYRLGRLVPVEEQTAFEIDLSDQRERLAEVLRRPPLEGTMVSEQLGKLLAGPIPTVAAADVMAFHLLEDVSLKQRLLAETDVRARVTAVARALNRQFPHPLDTSVLAPRFGAEGTDPAGPT